MEILRTIVDADIGSDVGRPATLEERRASRAIVFDADGNVALLHATRKHYHKLPGGGIEAGEGIHEALRRETLEEIGCHITNIRDLGIIEEYRNKLSLHQISYCFIADVLGEKGEPHLEEGEIADGFDPVWMDLESAIQTLEAEDSIENYEGRFIRLRDLTFLKEAKKLLDARKG